MTFSIIIPTYNGSKYVAQAIESVLAQTRKPDEIIISDDNSSDNTVEICRKYVPYVKVVVNKNGPSGFVNGWNNAIAYATSDFISILHQDDLLAPDFLKEAEKALSENPDVKHFFVPCDYIDGNGKIIRTPDYCDGSTRRLTGREYVYEYRHKGEPKLHRCPGVITARSIFSQCKYREEAGHIADDDFFYRVGNFTDILGLYKPLAFYREHVGSETGHLMQSQLVRRLLHDMDFQYRNAHFNPLFDEKIKEEFKYWKNKYIIRLFVYSLKSFKIDDVRCALNYVNILDLVRYLSGYCRQFVSQLVKNLMGGVN